LPLLPPRWACRLAEVQDRLAAPLVCEQLRYLGAISGADRARVLSGLCQDSSLESLLLALPLRAVVEEMFAGLGLVLAPPAFGVWPTRRPLEVLACETVPRLQLAKPRGEPRVGSREGFTPID